jgi:hypothetical protein
VGDGAPITAPAVFLQWLSLVLVAGFVAFTVWLRGALAARAWLLVLLYLVLVAGLLGATRLGSVYSAVAGMVPRYIADVVVVAAIAVGAALCGLRREGLDQAPSARPVPAAAARLAPRVARPALLGGLALLVASAAFTGIRYGDEWSVKSGRDYLANARADLERLPAGTVFMDQPVPEPVVGRLSGPYNMQSRFFAPLEDGPVFVTEGREVSVFDETGRVRPGWVEGVRARPGPRPGCGYRVSARPVRVPLQENVAAYWHVVRIAYLSDRDTSATMRIGSDDPVGFAVHKGLNAQFMIIWGAGADVELTLADPATSFCTDELVLGKLVPAPAG